MRLSALLVVLVLWAPIPAAARQAGEFVVGAGVGGSYYCIVSRCDTGRIARLAAGYGVSASVGIDAGVRWHSCFDCDRFRIYEGGLRLQFPASRARPFVAAGIHRSTDPGLMGGRTGPYGAIGVSIGNWSGVRFELQVLGRGVGSGDRMGEATLAVMWGVNSS